MIIQLTTPGRLSAPPRPIWINMNQVIEFYISQSTGNTRIVFRYHEDGDLAYTDVAESPDTIMKEMT